MRLPCAARLSGSTPAGKPRKPALSVASAFCKTYGTGVVEKESFVQRKKSLIACCPVLYYLNKAQPNQQINNLTNQQKNYRCRKKEILRCFVSQVRLLPSLCVVAQVVEQKLKLFLIFYPVIIHETSVVKWGYFDSGSGGRRFKSCPQQCGSSVWIERQCALFDCCLVFLFKQKFFTIMRQQCRKNKTSAVDERSFGF
jgi:hypothetical protein